MTTTHQPTAGLAVDTYTSPAHLDRITSPSGRPARGMPLSRKYRVAHLTPFQEIVEQDLLGPDADAFEQAFAAIGHGAIVQTSHGPMAVEDLLPGDSVLTNEHGMQTLLWHGRVTLSPDHSRATQSSMTRITADALGLAKPSADLVLGPAARILHSNGAVKQLTGQAVASIPARDFVDLGQFIALRPIAPVSCYQIGFGRHCSVNLNGVAVETLHPGPAHQLRLGPEERAIFMRMFPHMTCLQDFGTLAAPRLRQADLDLVRAA